MFFSFVIDCYSRMIVGWQFAAHMRTELADDALQMAAAIRGVDQDSVLIHHCDRGSQGSTPATTSTTHSTINGILGSLGSTGDA